MISDGQIAPEFKVQNKNPAGMSVLMSLPEKCSRDKHEDFNLVNFGDILLGLLLRLKLMASEHKFLTYKMFYQRLCQDNMVYGWSQSIKRCDLKTRRNGRITCSNSQHRYFAISLKIIIFKVYLFFFTVSGFYLGATNSRCHIGFVFLRIHIYPNPWRVFSH